MRSQIQIFTKAAERTFQKKRSSTSGGDVDDDEDIDPDSIITPAELAVLNCLMEGGFVLSLKVCIYSVEIFTPKYKSRVRFRSLAPMYCLIRCNVLLGCCRYEVNASEVT